MKALFIGGTGTISAAISELAVKTGWELYLLNRGKNKLMTPEGAKEIICDINDEERAAKLIDGMTFDVVADFIAYVPGQIERDIRLFAGKTKQYIFISSATVYKKPPATVRVTEDCVLDNPYWKYAQDKIACEEVLHKSGREKGFPYTIVRPSHTYGLSNLPVAIHGKNGFYQVLERIKSGKPVIVHGDGTTLWTLTHNSDFAKAFVPLMANPHAVQECYHITSDEALTWNVITEIFGAAVGVKPEIVHIPSDFLISCDVNGYDVRGALLGDKANVALFDNSKIKSIAPGFVCTTRFDQGVRLALDFIDRHPEFKSLDAEFDAWCDRVINACDTGLKAF